MTSTAAQPPLHMRRNGFDPVPELREIRDGSGVVTDVNPFGMQVYLITRYDDVKAVLLRFVKKPPVAAALAGVSVVTVVLVVRRIRNG